MFAVFSHDGQVVFVHKIKTPTDYVQFKQDISEALKTELTKYRFSHCCCAVPGMIDFKSGVALAFGNESWRNVPIGQDVQEMLPGVNILLHNDAKLAGLSETILLQKKYKKVLYLTISTGIGGGVIIDDKISDEFENFEPGQMVFEVDGQKKQWEDIASGRALRERYGKLASEIEDENIWKEYTQSLITGMEDLLATVQPDAVIFGGGVGAHFEKFQKFLEDGLKQINNPLVPTPPLLKAQRPEEAVIYGCYEYIKQNL